MINKTLLFLAVLNFVWGCGENGKEEPTIPQVVEQYSKVLVEKNGTYFRDLNHNGLQDVYEDPAQSIEARIDDLLSQMNIEEKAGMMFITMIAMNEDGSLMERPTLSNPFSFMMPKTSKMVAGQLKNPLNQLASSEPFAPS